MFVVRMESKFYICQAKLPTKNFPKMDISQIKQQLPLSRVLHHYGLKPDKNLRLQCPFHDDKKPSMQVYYKTHTAYCFSANCPTHGHSMDVVDFILYKENCTKAEAIAKAVQLISPTPAPDGSGQALPQGEGGAPRASAGATEAATRMQAAQLTRTAVLSRVFIYFKNGVHNSGPARAYIASRGLDYTRLEIGYNSGQFHHGARRDEALIKSCVEAGLLSEGSRNTRHTETEVQAYRTFAKYCICFALRDKSGQVAGMYFRSAVNDKDQKHFYLKDREGLYPKYPDPQTEKLIITEAVIDAASLLQIPKITEQYGILAAYGTNGITEEHRAAIKELRHLKEIIFAFDADEAGSRAAERYAHELSALCPYLSFSKLNLPEGEDINSIDVAHQDKAVFTKLLGERDFFFSTAKAPQSLSRQSGSIAVESAVEKKMAHPGTVGSAESLAPPATLPANDQRLPANDFNTDNPFKLCFTTGVAHYYVQGGVAKAMDSLKITLVIAHRITGQKSRSKVDLYEDRQVEKLCREASEKLSIRRDFLEGDLYRLTDLLEDYRDRISPSPAEKGPGDEAVRPVLTTLERQQAEDVLKSNHLIKELQELLGRCGIVGEEKARLFLFIITLSYKCKETLHALIQGSSGSGKTRLLQQISDAMPPEDVLRFTRVTESSLYNYPEHFLTNKLLCFEDIDGLKEEAQYAVRELISNGQLSSSTSVKNEAGQIQSQIKTVRGPIASLAATTRGEVYEDNLSRVFLVAVDESAEQTARVIDYQNRKAAGEIHAREEGEAKRTLQNIVRCLEAKEVVNPFAASVKLPPEAHKIRRLNELFQCFIRMVTLLHQYQRKQDDKGRLIATREDVKAATGILFESIVLKVDELNGSLRQFYEQLKSYLKTQSGNGASGSYKNAEFTLREIRHALKCSKTQLFRYTGDLQQLEYICQSGGHANKGYTYKISYWDDYEALRARIRDNLKAQLEAMQ